MDAFILFLQNYWQILVFLLFGCFELLLLIFKKPVKVDSLKAKILSLLPLCISIVEGLGIVGSAAKKSACIQWLKRFVSYSSEYDDFVSMQIERILCTPQKKGNTTDEK